MSKVILISHVNLVSLLNFKENTNMITKANNSRCFLYYFKTTFKVVIFYLRQLVKKSLLFFLVLSKISYFRL